MVVYVTVRVLVDWDTVIDDVGRSVVRPVKKPSRPELLYMLAPYMSRTDIVKEDCMPAVERVRPCMYVCVYVCVCMYI